MLAVIQKWNKIQGIPLTPIDKYDLKDLVAHDSLIVKTPGVCGGSPRICNTRIPVRSLVQYRQCGTTDTELLEIYPTLHQKDLEAAYDYYALHQDEIEQEIEEENSL
jgi:uncharacterized protein (DUF433 family)